MARFPQQSAQLGFIGIGAMGLPMIGRLVAAGHSVTAWDHASERLVAAERAGANVAGTAAAVARATEIVFLCLTDAAAVEMVICGPDGVSSVPAPGKLVVDFSSIPPDSACSIAARLNAMNGMSWIDAPVSGGPPGAANGTLAVMAGGEPTDIERVKPYVLAIAQRITHMGPIGAGQTTKLCNQIIAACTMVVLAEATRFAVDAGIDAARLPEALAGGFGDSIPLQMFVPRMANCLDQPTIGAVSIIIKDLDTIADVARARATPLPMASLATQMFRLLNSRSGPKIDVLEIYGLADPKPR